MEYNTQLPQMIFPEYGRHVQKMVQHCISISNRDERNKCARSIIDLMGQLNPSLRDVADFKHKLWDHLFIIAEFKLDVDSPYPLPGKDILTKKPERLPYPSGRIKYKHYGHYVESLIKKCLEHESEEQRTAFTEVIANIMKKNFLNWNRDSVNDEVVVDHLENLSGGKLKLKENTTLRSTQEILKTHRVNNTSGGGSTHKSKKFKKGKKHY
ncbi:MAG: DUF4290 domain-containing protein [Bacteroidia bacterium]|nr:DUF4290 domain-containing protein [Bacteroidia bacterium]